ncbi:MAG: nitrogen fixation protein NifQ [Tepidimonas sp.]|uniref:nitrogen fixation protein NifQ n=1 Tax=Tepidimonas sp. TaxID=2002775 RepID=UPI00259FD704|nr:nitrogen fixation protein NifQ [Tepidimonas sp.]MDM7457094.1 nitrogen fixation protein NifQ [Tepidimonas sp.]
MSTLRPCAVVRGAQDLASAVACALTDAGYAVVMAEGPLPAVTRRGQAFADAAFDGSATFLDKTCRRIDDIRAWRDSGSPDIAYSTAPLDLILAALTPELLVDARMRKRAIPEDQRELAPLVIGLGPNFDAGGNCHLAVETGWGETLGSVVEKGPTRALAGEPKPVNGWSRDRYVYAPVAGVFQTRLDIGDTVTEGQVIARIGDTPIAAPKTGVVRGLIRDGVPLDVKQKCVEIVPAGTNVRMLAERPRRAAEGVLAAIRLRHGLLPVGRKAIHGVLANAAEGLLPPFARTLGFDAASLPGHFAPLVDILMAERAPELRERPARWLAHAIACSAFGQRHTWQDLRLSGRREVSAMFALHFPAFAARNTPELNLKWRRFLFHELGLRLGVPALMPPGCSACDGFAECFGDQPEGAKA